MADHHTRHNPWSSGPGTSRPAVSSSCFDRRTGAHGLGTAQLDLLRRLDNQQVRQQTSRELEHQQVTVTAVYLGSYGHTLRKRLATQAMHLVIAWRILCPRCKICIE